MGPVSVRTYRGETKERAALAFAEDATSAAAGGYEPVNQEWDGTTLIVTYRNKTPVATPISGVPARTIDLASVAILIGGAMVAAGSVLPWITASSGFVTQSRSGMEGGDGLFTIGIGIGLALLGLAMAVEPTRKEGFGGLPLVVSIVALVVSGFEWFNVNGKVNDPTLAGNNVFASVGIGIWIMVVGSIIAAAAAWNLRSAPAPETSQAAPESSATK